MHRLRCRMRAQDGAATVEFALVMPLLVFFMFGILQFGLFFYRWQGIQTMAHEGARGGSVGLTVKGIADRIESAMAIPAEFSDVTIAVVLYDDSSGTEVSRIDGKTTNTTLQDTSLCEGVANPRDYSVSVEVSLDKTVTEYQIIIPLFGSVKVNYGSAASFGCEAVS